MPRTNKDKGEPDPVIDEVLNETPPPIEEPVVPTDEETAIPEDERLPDPENEEPKVEEKEEVVEEKSKVEPKKEEPKVKEETQEEKDKRYKAQQTEAQIQAARTKALTDKVDEAANIPAPTEEELRNFVAQDGVNWDELTTFEQATAKRTYLNDKRFQLINEATQTAKKVDEWAKKVDDFIDSTDGKPEYVELSSHEVDFRRFAMIEAHRGTPLDVLLPAFLHNLLPTEKKKGSLFETGGGGEKIEQPDGIIDADTVAKLRQSDPREYKRLLKADKIKLEV